MPRIEEIFEKIGSSVFISALDLAKGYWLIPMMAGSKEKTAFATLFGLYAFDVLPFGLATFPATFQRMRNHILRECKSISDAYI